MDDKIVMIMDDGTETEFTVLETTTLGGVDYILVTDAPEIQFQCLHPLS